MPRVYFAGDAISEDYDIEMHEAMGAALAYSVRYYPHRPAFGGGSDPADGRYKYVVVSIESTELNEEFAKPGYYLFVGLRPHVAQRHFGIPEIRAL
ncbi:MAG: hypothetical protein U1F41_12895 [Burkholderiales bacterium]